MRRVASILAPLAVFVLAAVAAWLAGNGDNRSERQDLPRRTRHAIRTERIEAVEGLAGLEREFLLDTAKPAEAQDAAGMEAALEIGRGLAATCGSGMTELDYASRWAEEAPKEMLKWLTLRGPIQPGARFQIQFYAYVLFSQWAEDDLKSALPAALALNNPDFGGQALLSCAEFLALTDPAGARELLEGNMELFSADRPEPTFKGYESGKTICELLVSLPPSAGRTRMLAVLLDKKFIENQAVTAWATMPESLQREIVAAGFSGNSLFEGSADLLRELAESTGDRETALRFLANHGRERSLRDLLAAVEWTQTHLKGRDRSDFGAAIFRNAASQDFDNTVARWRELPDGVLKEHAAIAIVEGAMADRRPEAEALVKSLSARDQK